MNFIFISFSLVYVFRICKSENINMFLAQSFIIFCIHWHSTNTTIYDYILDKLNWLESHSMSWSTICHFINSYNLLPTNVEGPTNKSHQTVGVDTIPSSIIGAALSCHIGSFFWFWCGLKQTWKGQLLSKMPQSVFQW